MISIEYHLDSDGEVRPGYEVIIRFDGGAYIGQGDEEQLSLARQLAVDAFNAGQAAAIKYFAELPQVTDEELKALTL